jgi:hypothetical protein
MVDIFGLVGTICFLIGGLPQAYKSLKEGHSHGIALPTALLWCVGEVALLAYVLGKYWLSDWFLLSNYVVNNITCAIILWYKLFPRK